MTEEEKTHIAAEKLYEAYGEDAQEKVVHMRWSEQVEGHQFWFDVYVRLVYWSINGKPA